MQIWVLQTSLYTSEAGLNAQQLPWLSHSSHCVGNNYSIMPHRNKRCPLTPPACIAALHGGLLLHASKATAPSEHVLSVFPWCDVTASQRGIIDGYLSTSVHAHSIS